MVLYPHEFYPSPHGFVSSTMDSMVSWKILLTYHLFFLIFFPLSYSQIDILVIVAIWKIIHVTLVLFSNVDLPVQS